jgi:hypothetical protein
MVQVGPSIKQDLISKITSAKMAGGMAQVVGHLLSKHMALSTTNITKKKKKEGKSCFALLGGAW